MSNPLPPNWTVHQTEDGKQYFYNSATGESSWNNPSSKFIRNRPKTTFLDRKVKDEDLNNIGLILILTSLLIFFSGYSFPLWGIEVNNYGASSVKFHAAHVDYLFTFGQGWEREGNLVAYSDKLCYERSVVDNCDGLIRFSYIFTFLLFVSFLLGIALRRKSQNFLKYISTELSTNLALLISLTLLLLVVFVLPSSAQDSMVDRYSNPFFYDEEAKFYDHSESEKDIGPLRGFFLILAQFLVIVYLKYSKLRLNLKWKLKD